ncbi:DUF2075 domain-containing protein [Hymenobacter rigui]|uniref:DUF2075 domain-containing protein n=1 Tax=Hymenobacter rigui TaxID=334424 RepID=A0A3R9MLS0_9BACT|nr:DUF2075 domain-containing protein [Hymenobacter rigui]RSK48742.1 DUF2075 domain-containing protein [Hymenobacter rigui]
MQRAYYHATVPDFLQHDETSIMGVLALAHEHALEDLQKQAWQQQIRILKRELAEFPQGYLLLEVAIPRMGKRADAVLLLVNAVYVLEFKVGSFSYDQSGQDQVLDYALDLKNFHAGSHQVRILPVLIATRAAVHANTLRPFDDGVYEPLLTNAAQVAECLRLGLRDAQSTPIVPMEWLHAGYQPTPTIIEAAQALYKGHQVTAITRSDAGAANLAVTGACIAEIIEEAKAAGTKHICFVTGVPGAGKTLAGLNIAVERTQIDAQEHAVFLSGNGPLVDVLREALARDKVREEKQSGTRLNKKQAVSQVKSFIQNIHHFRDEALRHSGPPLEKVTVFDEAQRAWSAQQATKFMQQKRGQADFNMSEPEFLVEVMDRHADWCTVVCLIGGGQEINTGEAGLQEWLRAFESRFPHWHIHYSRRILTDRNYLPDQAAVARLDALQAQPLDALHLAVSVRSFRAERLAAFVQAVLDADMAEARRLYTTYLATVYPLRITRQLAAARTWLRQQARGTERYGLVASSGAHRLKPLGLNIRDKIDAPVWFLNERDDVRSSYYLEDVATEFDIQGLELDWVGVAWDADLWLHNGQWQFRKFVGTRWQNCNTADSQRYLLNAYRVLLTRARQGMVIFIPEGSAEDPTRRPEFYQEVYAFFRAVGVPEVE